MADNNEKMVDVSSPEAFSKFVMNAEVNIEYSFALSETPLSMDYRSFNIEKSSFWEPNREQYYSWSIRTGYRNIYPMKDRQYVKCFKTEFGAKRSLIKHCAFIFRNK